MHDRLRSLPLSTFAPLWDIGGVTLCVAAEGPAAAEVRDFAARGKCQNLAPNLHDFGETAAAIAESRPRDHGRHVDRALGRRDGKAGVDSLHEPSEYRWLTEREDSPWYPTARLFRQKRRGDWDEVIGRVKEALREWVAGAGRRRSCRSERSGS